MVAQLAPRASTPAPRRMGLFRLDLQEPEFRLHDGFLDRYVTRDVAWGPVGYVTYKRTYSRTKPNGRSEEWWETVRRVVEGTYRIQQRHCAYNNVPWIPQKATESAEDMFDRIFNFKFTPPGRGLWMMGTEYIEQHGSAALNNCAFVSTKDLALDFAEPFCFLMDMSMLGVGVGGDTAGAGSLAIDAPKRSEFVEQIGDNREAWIDAVRDTLRAYTGDGILPTWDYSLIRPYGSDIKGFGGKAAGPDPLRTLLEDDIPKILDPLVGKKITSGAIVDLFNVVGKCVVAGNVRRSAEIMFGQPSDEEFLDLKNPELHAEEMESHRWASNNSIFAQVGMDYAEPAARTGKAGEPGYIWLDNIRRFGRMADPPDNRDHRAAGSNPCVEQTLESYELCCLVETFPAHHDSYEDYERTLKKAYLYAKTVTLLPTHNPKTNAVMMRNRRIGTSQSGIVQNFAKIGRRRHFTWCDQGYQYIQKLDRIYSDWLAVPTSIKTTSVKPSGTVSKLCGATSGIHYPPAEFYIQRIRFGFGSPLLKEFERAGYKLEPCVYTPNTMVVEIPVREKHFYKAETDVSLWEQIGNAVAMQKWWADNQVSCTVKFDNSDPEKAAAEIAAALELHQDELKGISFLPHAHGYKQPPWEPITQEDYEMRILGLAMVHDFTVTEATNDTIERFCNGDKCDIVV